VGFVDDLTPKEKRVLGYASAWFDAHLRRDAPAVWDFLAGEIGVEKTRALARKAAERRRAEVENIVTVNQQAATDIAAALTGEE